MNQMIGIVLMIAGVLAFAGGVITYKNSSKKEEVIISENKSGEVGMQQKLVNMNSDAEVDDNEKKGYEFEKFIVQKFNKRHFRIKEWAGDKYVNGIYAETTMNPDIQVIFTFNKDSVEFSVECKWRKKLYNGGVSIGSEEQLERYTSFEKKQNSPVFIAIGIGGEPNSPEQLFIVPLKVIDTSFIHLNGLKKYEKAVKGNFFFDSEINVLR